jgi:hypothetical protein
MKIISSICHPRIGRQSKLFLRLRALYQEAQGEPCCAACRNKRPSQGLSFSPRNIRRTFVRFVIHAIVMSTQNAQTIFGIILNWLFKKSTSKRTDRAFMIKKNSIKLVPRCFDGEEN